jgi:hypothetical protein
MRTRRSRRTISSAAQQQAARLRAQWAELAAARWRDTLRPWARLRLARSHWLLHRL